MVKDEVVAFFDDYARSFAAPVQTDVAVTSVRARGEHWEVASSAGRFAAQNVVVATGHYASPAMPAFATRLPSSVRQLTPSAYRNPMSLPDGAILVVGAGPSGQQIARELARAGRQVLLAVGRHQPLPRHYRGADAYDWLNRTGVLLRTVDTLPDPAAAANAPSVVLAGGVEDLHLRGLASEGVTVLGRLVGADGSRLWFADDLPGVLGDADEYAARFRAKVDGYIRRTGISAPAAQPVDMSLPAWALTAPRMLDTQQEHIGAVIWASGYRRDYSWVQADVFDGRGEPIQRRGVTAAPGLAFLGLRFMYRRSSNFIDGVGADAEYLAEHITSGRAAAAA